MVSFQELKSRIRLYLRFSAQELQGIIIGILVTGFIFSFRYWGVERFEWAYGLKNLFWITIAAGLGFFGHILPQKIYALAKGYQAEFRTWWLGIISALVLSFITRGYLSLILAGGVGLSLMTRQRLGEFRYGTRQDELAVTGLWGVLGSLIMATLFRMGNYFLPEVLFFERGMMISLVFAICSVLPLPWLDGLTIFFGGRGVYFISVVIVVVAALLLLLGGGWGLLVGIILGLVAGLIAFLYGSEL